MELEKEKSVCYTTEIEIKIWLPFAPHLKAEVFTRVRAAIGSVYIYNGEPGLLVKSIRFKHSKIAHGYIPVIDDRFARVYMKGDWIGVRRLLHPMLINYGSEYLVFTQDYKGLLCRIIQGKREDSFLLEFDNRWYRPKYLKKEQILAAFAIEVFVPKLP